MTGAIAHEQAQRLREGLDQLVQSGHLEATGATRDAIYRVVDILESSPDAVVLSVDDTLSTQEAADLLGVSRMTVVRLIERGELESLPYGKVHRRLSASEVARYRDETASKRRAALAELAQDLDESTPPDQIIRTR